MKKIKSILLISGLTLLLSSCSDFLDKESLSELSAEGFWNSKQDAEMALVGCYDALQAEGLYFVWPGPNTCSPRE